MNRYRGPFIRRRSPSGWQICIAVSDRSVRIVALADRLRYSPEERRVTAWKVKILASGMEFEAPSLYAAEEYLKEAIRI